MRQGRQYNNKVGAWILAAALLGVGNILAGCTTPGAAAPSTVPVGEHYVELSKQQENSSCGYTALMIPLKNPAPLSILIEEMLKTNGGDALIDVDSNSSSVFYGVGMANCLSVRGKVVKIAN